jgi:5'-3' exonuclease
MAGINNLRVSVFIAETLKPKERFFMKTVLIDFRNLCKIASYSIMSGEIACTFPTEMEEIGYRIVKWLLALRLDYPEDQLYLLNDKPPYWRSAFLVDWYTKRGLEPVIYKGNRNTQPWLFKTSKTDLETFYDQIKNDMSFLLEATIVEEVGYEADDIFGLMARTMDNVVGCSNDSDWRQLCSDNVSILDLYTNMLHNDPIDIRIKYIAGDAGDNIKGCPKKKKDGTSTTNWGPAGAAKLLQEGADFEEILDEDILLRNTILVKLPCPIWNIAERAAALPKHRITSGNGFDHYGVTAPIRAIMRDTASRHQWVNQLRTRLQQSNKEVKNGILQ